MADSEVATQAPESDAQETNTSQSEAEKISGIQGDSKAQEGASMGVSTHKNVDIRELNAEAEPGALRHRPTYSYGYPY